jgi:hypothetical protein
MKLHVNQKLLAENVEFFAKMMCTRLFFGALSGALTEDRCCIHETIVIAFSGKLCKVFCISSIVQNPINT